MALAHAALRAMRVLGSTSSPCSAQRPSPRRGQGGSMEVRAANSNKQRQDSQKPSSARAKALG